MDASSSNEFSKNWKEAVDRWRRVCEMGTEATLRKRGWSRKSVDRTVAALEIVPDLSLSKLLMRGTWNGYYVDEDVAILFATLGRGLQRVVAGPFHRTQFREYHAGALMVIISSNTTVSTLDLSGLKVFGTVKGCTLLGQALAANSSITDLDLSDVDMLCESLQYLLHGLESSTGLRKLRLDCNDLSDDGMKFIADFLRNNTTLAEVSLLQQTNILSSKHIEEAAIAMALALGTNVSLRTLRLDVRAMTKKDMERLLQPLSGDKNTTLRTLQLQNLNHEHVEGISHMIRTNTSVHYLSLDNNLSFDNNLMGQEVSLPFLPADWKKHIFPALGDNKTLQELDLSGKEGLTREVYESLIDVLQNSNTTLQSINLFATDLQSRQGQVNEELRINRAFRHQLKTGPQSEIISGRIVLCGYGFAGKSEITKTMKGTEEEAWLPRLSNSLKSKWTKLAQKVCGEGYKEWAERTRGFQVVTLKKQPYVKSIWDFAGQKEYYALHDYVFPDNKNSHFLYVCSCRYPPDNSNRAGQVKDEDSIRGECEFWMRFLASNSKPVRQKLLRVSFVLTKTDTLTLEDSKRFISMVGNVVGNLSLVFTDVLDLSTEVEVVDSRSPDRVKALLSTCNDNLEKILENQKEYAICHELRNLLQEWSTTNPNKPVLRIDEFLTLCRKRKNLKALPEDDRMSFLAYLNDLGEIVFPKESEFIVTNPTWFGKDVLGSLINAFKGAHSRSVPIHHEQGFVTKEAVVKHLESSLENTDLNQSIPAEELIDLMIRLELCFESQPNEEERTKAFFVPALFDDKMEVAAIGRRELEWKLDYQSRHFQYLGRRLECQNRATTFLTPGFFPRLQIRLHNYVKRNWTKNLVFEVGRNLIRFAENGIEVCVEYAGDNDDFIDILVRSSKPFDTALKFIEEHVVQTIRTFCASPQGCQGVDLVESIIRPVCVEKLHLCIDRKPHSVSLTFLEDKFRVDEGYQHTWSAKLDGDDDVVLASDLLRGTSSSSAAEVDGDAGAVLARDLLRGTSSSSSPSSDDFPGHFFASFEDVGGLDKIVAGCNFTKVTPLNFHIPCQVKEPRHEGSVKFQRGRRLDLKNTDEGYDVNVARVAIDVGWIAVQAGAKPFGVSVPDIDKWVQKLFESHGISGLNADKVRKLVSTRKHAGPVSQEQILKELNMYLKIDPRSQGLKEFLRLEDGKSFTKDFNLRKVIYTKGDDEGKVGWLCDKCFEEGFKKGILRSQWH